MQLNKKGITSVELLVCFIIVSTIVVSMYNLILNYRNREQIEEVNNEVISFSNNLQKVIQDDLINGHLVNVTNVSDDLHSATFSFDNPSRYDTSITIKPDEGVISYGKSGDVVDYKIPSIPDLMLSPDSKIEYFPATNGYLKITIILTHPNFDNETYSFMINCPITDDFTVDVPTVDNPSGDEPEGDKPAGDVIIDNLTCDATYDDGEDTFITSSCGDPNNYVWYSGKLWRAVSVNNEAKTTKLVTQWNETSLSYNANSSSFKDSYIEKWLNDTSVDGFLGNLRNYKNFIVTDAKWNATATKQINNKPLNTIIVTDTVGLLTGYEFKIGCMGAVAKDGYLVNGLNWWTLTPYDSSSFSSLYYVSSSGGSINNSPTALHGIRPSIILKSDVSITEGDGSIDNPYRLKGDNDTNLSGTKLNTRYSGEYIRFGVGKNNLYRIVSHETEGLTKITSAEPLKDSESFKTSAFGSETTFSSTNTIGTFLNGDYLTSYVGDTYSNMIEDNTKWYLGTVGFDTSYKLSKYTNETGNILTSSTTTAKVGLLRFGELSTGQYERYAKKGESTSTGLTIDYWLLTPYNSTEIRFVNAYSYGKYENLDNMYGIRPALNLKSNVVITGGDGTKNNPFTIALQ